MPTLWQMPFAIMRGETEIDTSEDYQNKVGWLPDPWRLLYLTRGIADRVLACVLVERAQPVITNCGALCTALRR